MYSSHSIVYHITAEFYQTLNKNRITMTNFLNLNKHGIFWELPWWCSGKESACQCRRCKRQGFSLWVGKIPWRRKWQPMPVFLPGKSHGQWSLVDYSPRDCRESDTTECTCTKACAHTVFFTCFCQTNQYKKWWKNTNHFSTVVEYQLCE